MNADVTRVRLELAIRKHVTGNDYVTARRLADFLPWSSREVSFALSELEDRGEVTREFSNGSAATYRIWLEEDPSEGPDEETKRLEKVTR